MIQSKRCLWQMNSIWIFLRTHLYIDYAYGLERYLKCSYLWYVNSCIFSLRDKAHSVGKAICERLKDSLPRQLFEIAIQAAVGSKIIARETWVEIHFCSCFRNGKWLEMIGLELYYEIILKNLTSHWHRLCSYM